MLYRMSPDGSNLAPVSRQPGQIYAMEADREGSTYVAGQTTGGRSGSCFGDFNLSAVPPGDIFVTKLRPDTLEQAFSARLSGDCQTRPGALRIGPTGEVTVGVWAFRDLPMRNPVLPVPSCQGTAAVSRFSADGSALLFSSYLDMCAQSPAIALAPDGSVYAGVASGANLGIGGAGVLKVPVLSPGGMSVERAVNAFSGVTSYATPSMLLTITGQDLALAFIDLGLNNPNPLPTELGGVQVLVDDTLAEMFQVAPDHLICVVPAGVMDRATVSVEVISGPRMATPFILPFTPYGSLGLLTHSFPKLPPAGSVDGNIRNADGTVNDPQHPAAPGSTVTLFGTGLTGPGVVPLLWNAPPPRRAEFLYALSGTARRMPGFIHAIYAIDFRIPDSPGQGVYLVPTPGVLTRAEIGRVGSGLGVYVK